MKRRVLAFMLVGVSTSLCGAQEPVRPDSTEKCVVKGRVIDASSGAPVRKARVFLNTSGKAPIAAITDLEGRFTFDQVLPGGYMLHANRDEYVPGFWSDSSPQNLGRAFVLEPGQHRDGFVIHLSRQGVIFGRIYDSDGEPVTDAWVYAIEFSQFRVPRDLVGHQSKETNDLGEYRLYGLRPGRYAVCARRRSQVEEFSRETGVAERDGSRRETYLPTCFPNTADRALASAVTVQPGDELRVDLTLLRGQMFTVRGRVQVPANVSRLESVQIWLSSPDLTGVAFSEHYSAEARAPQYSFELQNVRRGPYLLKARAEQGKKSFEAKQSLEVVGADVEEIVMRVMPGAEVSGKVHFIAGDQKILRYARVELDGDELYGQPGEMGELHPDGTFRFDNVWTSEYRVAFFSQEEKDRDAGFYVRSATLGGRVLDKNRFQVVAGITYSDLEVWVARSSAVVEGIVSRDARPTYGAAVCLFPDGRTRNSGVPNCARCDERGAFRIERAIPGKFRLIALEEENDLMQFEEVEFWDLLEKHGKLITIEEKSKLHFSVSPVPRPSAEKGAPKETPDVFQ